MDPTNVGGGKRATWFNFKNIRVYCESSLCFSTSNIWKFERERKREELCLEWSVLTCFTTDVLQGLLSSHTGVSSSSAMIREFLRPNSPCLITH